MSLFVLGVIILANGIICFILSKAPPSEARNTLLVASAAAATMGIGLVVFEILGVK